MKLITDKVEVKTTINEQAAPVTPPHIEVEPPVTFTVCPTTAFTWKESNLSGLTKEVSINQGIKDWMKADASFKNFVMTCLVSHISLNPLDAIEYPLPDQYREDIGMVITIETFAGDAFEGKLIDGRRREKPDLKECTIHVFN